MTTKTDRTQHRHTLSLHMEVYRGTKDKTPIFKCRTRNIGFGGVSIRNRGFNLRKGSRVKLLLIATCRSVKKQFPVDAKIVWQTPKAIGLKFYPGKDTELREFRRFLLEAKVSAHARIRRRMYADEISATVIP